MSTMKKLHAFLLLAFLVFGTSNISAQKELKEGSITIGITELESSDPQAAAMAGMVKTSTMKYDFNALKTLMTANVMNGMIQMRVLVDNNTKATTMLMDMMGQKSMTNISAEEAKKSQDMEKMNLEDLPVDLSVTYDKKDTKEILGHKCFKANFNIKPKSEEDAKKMEEVDFSITAYVTDQIKFPQAMIKQYEEMFGNTGFKMTDFPLECTITFNDGKNNGKITLAATDIKRSLDNGVFELDTTGYEEKSIEEMMKGGPGGF